MSTFEHLLDEQEEEEFLFQPITRTPEEEDILRRDSRKERIRLHLFNEIEVEDLELVELTRVADIDLSFSFRGAETLFGLLVDTDVDPRGTETPLDAFGRTAMMLVCDPEFHAKLSEREMDKLHRLDVLEDLVFARCRFDTPDKRGRTPWGVAPFWLKKFFANYHRSLKKYEH